MQAKILTPLQQEVLLALFGSGLGEMGYYLTGGTALSEFYLQHRYSDDLDLFTRESRDLREDFEYCRSIFDSLELTTSHEHMSDQHITAALQSGSAPPLRIDIARDVPAKMALPLTRFGLIVDSFEDIAVNKVCTILSRMEP
jgi:predicted nucleotidyltransferase component of viral defense system